MSSGSGLSQNFLILAMFIFQFIIVLYSDPDDMRPIKAKLFSVAFYLIFMIQKIGRRQFDFPLIFNLLVAPGLFYLMWISKSLPVLIYTTIMFILYTIVFYLLRIVDFPKPSGKYLIGYRNVLIDNVGHVAVFYPTDQTTKDVAWLTERNYLEILLDASFHKHFPAFIKETFIFCFSFLKTIPLGVQKDAQLALNLPSLNVMVFSHGLGGNRHGYSVFLRDMASNGYVVFACDHPEKIIILPHFDMKEIYKMVPIIKEVRGEQLEKRKEKISLILDFVFDEKKINSLFQREVSVNYEKIMLGGHSFGGITSIYTSLLDSRVRGGLICLDPYIFPMKDEFLSKNLNLPLLVINTESFDGSIKYAENMQRLNKLLNINGEQQRSLNLICRQSDHLHQCDLVFFFSEFMKVVKFINKKADIVRIIESNRRVIQFFMDDVILNGKRSSEVVDKIRDYSFSGILGKDIFAVQ